jgi:hypothetical protein
MHKELGEEERTETIISRTRSNWQRFKSHKYPLYRTMLASFGSTIVKQVMLISLKAVTGYYITAMVAIILDFAEENEITIPSILKVAMALVTINLLRQVIRCHSFVLNNRFGLQL